MSEPILVLGADLSTDMVKYEAIEARSGNSVASNSFVFYELYGAKYGLTQGCGFVDYGDGRVYIPYGLLADAVDLVLADAAKKLGGDRKFLRRIIISLQQHGMCALAPQAIAKLLEIGRDPTRLLSERIRTVFATEMATSWRHKASRPDCEELERRLCADRFAELTGSNPLQAERFMGAQIAYLYRTNREAFKRTDEFNVLAAIVAMILAGRRVGIGLDEASCTLLMNLRRGTWSTKTLRGVFPPGTFQRLPMIVPPGSDVGSLWGYHVWRHDLPPTCGVSMGFGDNIAICLTMASEPGQFGLSGGSSGTAYAEMEKPAWDRTHRCHVLRSGTGKYMGMYCTDQCGKFADKFRLSVGLTWDAFNQEVQRPTWYSPYQMILPSKDNPIFVGFIPGDNGYAAAVTRSIIADVLTSSAFMGKPTSIVATGGFIRDGVDQVVADMAQVPVFVSPAMNRVVRGSLVMAVHQELGEPISEVAARLCPRGREVTPDPARAEFYRGFLAEYVNRKATVA